MARATYIYLVTKDGEPIAAFTVKHEMESWIVRNPGTYNKFRMGDGGHGAKAPAEMRDDNG